MERSVVFAGFGGQGLLFAGQVLARAAMAEGREVFWIPAYGPEMRGGTAACTVIVADEAIGSPVVDRIDALVALNPPSLAKYEPLVAPGGLLVVNDSLIEAEPGRSDLDVARVRCTGVATGIGDERLTCVVALGALLARTGLAGRAAVHGALEALLEGKPPAVLQADLDALEAGWAAGTSATAGAPDVRPVPAGP